MSFIEDMFVESSTMTSPAGGLAACLSGCRAQSVSDGASTCDPVCFGKCADKIGNFEGESDCWTPTWEEIEEGGKLSEGFFGAIQLFGLMAGYGFVLVNAATLIGDGAELLLLVPSMATIVGTLVLPVLGAVPDGAIVFFSGLGPSAQEDLAVGMGALAGSTIMLLTIPWFLSIYAGRVDIVDGMCRYKPPKGQKKLSSGTPASACGISTDDSVAASAKLMLLTCLPYAIIQVPAFLFSKGHLADLHPNNTHHTGDIDHESDFAFVGLIICIALFFGCCIYFVKHGGSKESQNAVEMLKGKQQKLALEERSMNFTGLFRDEILNALNGGGISAASTQNGGGEGGMGASLLDNAAVSTMSAGANQSDHTKPHRITPSHIEKFLKPIFSKYDADSSGETDVHELRQLFRDLGEEVSEAVLQAIIQKYDADNNGLISFEEFVAVMIGYAKGEMPLAASGGTTNRTSPVQSTAEPGENTVIEAPGADESVEDEESDEEEEIPEDLAHLSPEEQQARIKKRALGKMALGTLLVLTFADPMCGCLSALGERTVSGLQRKNTVHVFV